MTASQGQARESNIRLLDNTSSPVLGIVPTDVQVRFKKAGEVVFSPKTLDSSNLEEVSDGYYVLRWDASDMSALGPFLFEVTSIGLTPFEVIWDEFDVVPATLTAVATPETCIVTGNIVDFGGNPAVGTPIRFNPVSGPITSGESLIQSTVLTTTPDAQGNFSVALLRNVEARVTIPEAGVNFKITVPDQETVTLKSLLPLP